MEKYVYPLLTLLNELSPYLLLGLLVAGILHEFVPRKIYADKLSGNKFSSVLYAALFGIPLPLCSCGVIPTAASLRREGASKGATVSFLISTPQTGVDSILATASLLGIPFAIIRPVVAFIIALCGGCITNRIAKSEKSVATTTHNNEPKEKNIIKRFISMFRYAFITMLQDIGKWIIIGLFIAAIITIAVPDNFFARFNDYPILNMLIILALSTPMYLCATGSIPIAAALMLKGLSPGAALVLLMAGPATNVATILVVNKVLGKKVLLTYLLTIIIGSMGFGLLIDYALPTEWFASISNSICTGCCTHEGTTWWQVASSILLVILLIIAFTLKFSKHDNCNCCNTTGKSVNKFYINGMMCNHCKANVENNIAKIEGVTSVRVELTEKAAYVEGEKYDTDEVINTINKLGYEYTGHTLQRL